MTTHPNAHEPELAKADSANDLGFDLPPPAQVSGKRALVVGVGVLGVLGLAFFGAYLPKRAAERALQESVDARKQARPQTAVITPALVSSERKLSLPASLQPLEEAVIYARASGYIRRWYVDIGAKVERGALLAEIETPEVEQELAQARAALAQAQSSVVQAQANQGLAKINLERTGKLVSAGVSPQQTLDQTQAQATVNDADVKVAESNVAAQRANIRRLTELLSFSRIEAPFAGTITQRSIETGSLVSAGTGSPLYRLAAMDPVRVYVQVPQDVAPSVRVGTPATVRLREFPGQDFKGSVARTTGSLDSATRTLGTEIRVPNPEGKLLSGMSGEVSLNLTSPHKVFQIPSTALLADAAGTRVLTVAPDSTVHSRSIVIERDLGTSIQIASGVSESDQLIQIAGADFQEGQHVDLKKVDYKPAP